MASKGHALSRDALIRTLTAYSGITTEDGTGTTTLVDTNLKGRNDFISGKTILIMSGDAKDEDKGALSFATGTGVITLRNTGVSAQIKAGTVFRVLNISSIEIDVANIQEDLGDMADAAATGSPTDTDSLMSYMKQVINEILGPSGTWSNLNNEAINSLDLAIQYIAAVMGFNGANVFNPVVGGVPRTNMDAVFGALDVVLQVIDANVDWIKEAAGNDNWGFGALRNHILTNKDLIEIVDANVDWIKEAAGNDNWGFGALRNHILVNKGLIEIVDTVVDAIEAKLDAMAGSTGIFYEQADVPVNINAVNTGETDVLHLSAADTQYIVRSLRLKCANPGVNTVTVRLYELIHDVLTEVDSFNIDAANFGTAHSLIDMFGLPHLAGGELQVTVRVSAGAAVAVTAQYSYAKNNV